MKSFSRLVFLLLLSTGFSSEKSFSQVSFESEDQLVAQANKLFVAGDYVNAMPLFSQLLSLHPKDANYNYKFGVCVLHNDEDKTKSLQYFDFAVKEAAVDKEAFFYAGKGCQTNARFDEALGFYEKYKTKAANPDPLNAERFIQQCKNGKNLYDKNVSLQALEKTETLENEFYRNYDLKAMKGRIIPKPLNFKSKKDVKLEDNTLIFVGTENQSIVYSGYNDEGLNTSRELFKVNKLPNGEWGLPINIGEPVNTDYDEEFAFLHPDGKTLYFSSEGHNTMGGYDIFRSVYDDQTGKWSAPVNLAHPINSPDDDIFYASDEAGTFAYFASKNFTKPGKIKVYKISTQGTVQSTEALAIKGAFVVNGERVYTKTEIKVTDKATNTLVGTYNSNRLTGKYLLLLPPGKSYSIEVIPEDFVSHKLDLIVPAKPSQEFFEQKINLQKDATGETLTVTNWFDATGKTAGTNIRSVLSNEQVAEKAKVENKKIITSEEFANYKTRKSEEEKLHADGQKKAIAEIESNKQEALLKAEADKKAAEAVRLKAEEAANAKQAEEQRLAAEKLKAEQELALKVEADKKAAAEAKLKAEQEALAKAETEKKAAEAAKLKAEEDKSKAEEVAKAKQAEEQRLATEKLKIEQDIAAKAEVEKKAAEEKQKAEQVLIAKQEQEQLAAAEKQKSELAEAERERIENEEREAERVAKINADVLEKERKLKELLAKAEQQNVKVETKHEFKLATDSLTPEQAAAYEKISREKEESKKAVEEQMKRDTELKAQQAKADAAAQGKFLAEKAAIEKEQKEKDEQDKKLIAEQKLKEQQATAEIDRKNKAVLDSIALAKNKKEKTVNTDSLAASNEAKRIQQLEEVKLKAEVEKQNAEIAAKVKEADEQRVAINKLKAEMEVAEKKANEQASAEKEKQQQEELKREQEKLKANLEEQKKLMEETIRQKEQMKKIEESLAENQQQKEQIEKIANETASNEQNKAEQAVKLKQAEEQRIAAEKEKTEKEALAKAEIEKKAAEEKRKTEEAAKAKQAEEQRIAAEKEKAEKETLAKAETERKAAEEKRKADDGAPEINPEAAEKTVAEANEIKRKAEEAAKAKQEEEKRLALEQQKKQEDKGISKIIEAKSEVGEQSNETPEQKKLRQLLERMNAEQKGRQIVENNLKAQQQTGNEALVNAQRYKEVVTNKEVVTVHKKEEKLRPPFDKTDLLSHQGVIYKLELKLPPVKIPDDIAALLKPGTGASEEQVYYSSGAYTTLAEATLDRNEFGYKGFTAGIVAYLNGEEVNISEAKKQPVVE